MIGWAGNFVETPENIPGWKLKNPLQNEKESHFPSTSIFWGSMFVSFLRVYLLIKSFDFSQFPYRNGLVDSPLFRARLGFLATPENSNLIQASPF